MAKIPQIMIYRNETGETILEIPSQNGARRTQVLASDPYDALDMIESALDTRVDELRDQVDAQELERSLRSQRKARITGLGNTEAVKEKSNQNPVHSEKYQGFKIKVYRASAGGVLATINDKLIRIEGKLDLTARFLEIAYAIRAARESIDSDPSSWPMVEASKSRDSGDVGTKHQIDMTKALDLDLGL